MQVKEIMKKVITASPKLTVKEVAKLMSDKGIGSVVIIQNSKIVGIVTERDILKHFSSLSRQNLTIEKIMSKDVKTIDARATINEAATIMSENKIKRLPVVEKGKLVGIVTATDLIAHSEYFDEPFLF